MDYEKKYKEALEKAQRFYNNSVAITKKGLEDIFPELKESEDERIRKAIYNCVKWFGFDSCFFKDVSQEECLAWIEKQCEKGTNGNERKISIPEPPLTIKHAKEVMGIKQDDAWSEEDEKCIENAIMYCEWARDIAPNLHCYEISEKSINWLKSLKERYTWKPSELQIGYLSQAIFTLGNEGDCATAAELRELRDNLEMLREK